MAAITNADLTAKQAPELYGISMAHHVLFCRTPGLLARAAFAQGLSPNLSLVVSDEQGHLVRDSCSHARADFHIVEGESLRAVRRRCPILAVVSVTDIDARAQTEEFLAALAETLPYAAIEPAGPDAAFVALALPVSAADLEQLRQALARISSEGDREPLIGLGPSRTAARALAECGGLAAERLGECDSRWLWPEDDTVAGRLFRLGLTTWSSVAELNESALIYQFGAKIGRQLYLRARYGRDLVPIRPLYPPPVAEAQRDLSAAPISDATRLRLVLHRFAARVSRRLRSADRVVRRLTLTIQTEEGKIHTVDAALITPAQDPVTVAATAGRLLDTIPIAAPVTRLHLLASETEAAVALTGDLFRLRQAADAAALKAVRHSLCQRFGPAALRTGAERRQAEWDSLPARERRRWVELQGAPVHPHLQPDLQAHHPLGDRKVAAR